MIRSSRSVGRPTSIVAPLSSAAITIGFALIAADVLAPSPALALDVTSTSPTPYALHVSRGLAQITVTFDGTPIAPAAGAVRVCGTMSGLHPVTVDVLGAVMTIDVQEPWLAGELVHVNLRSDITTIAADSLTDGHYFAFTIAAGAGPAEFPNAVVYPAASVPYFLFGGDLDGDGTPDLAVPNEGTNDVSVWTNPMGNATLSARADYGVGNTPSSVYGDDLNNDGALDLASADIASGTMSVLLNLGDGTFAPRVSYAAGAAARQVCGGDFDGDNDIDLCVTSFATDTVFLYYNQGNGTFSPGVPFTDLPDGPFAIQTGDVNLDGLIDIGVVCQNADSLAILENQGGGTFATVSRHKTGRGPWDLVGNDMDGDGDFDFLTVTAFNNRVQILRNDGGVFNRIGRPTDAFPLGVHAADLDGDGDLDVATSNFNGGTVGIYLNDGNAVLTRTQTLRVDRTGSYAWAHDLDGDGDLDLSVVDELTDSLYVFLNEPATNAPEVGGPQGSTVRLAASPNPARVLDGTELTMTGVGRRATIDIFTVDGRRVRHLYEGALPTDGSVRWDGRDASGSYVPSGAYVVRAVGDAGSASVTVRLLR